MKNSNSINQRSVESQLNNINGIHAVRIDPTANTVTVEYDESVISPSQVSQELKQNNLI